MMAEEAPPGNTGWSLYRSYAQFNGGFIWTVFILFSMFGWMIFNTFFNIWLSVWTANDRQKTDSYYLQYYIIFGVLYGVFAFFRALIVAIASPKMSKAIHESMISNLLFCSLN
eukprot:GHVR01141278.1.p1 GENE.GHVR01141278.1~~GHVR01141278.1.p1  ORF type:complete len:113 (+),score=2.21 GHVR01141278.1:231-569(+)